MPRRRRRQIVGACAVSLSLAACSLLTDLSGLSDPRGAADDAAASDSPTGADGAAEAAARDSSKEQLTYCEAEGPHDLCADFDRSGDPFAPFDSRDLGGGSLTPDTTEWRSAPRSVFAVMPSLPAGGGPAMKKTIAKAGRTLRCAVDVRREDDGDGSFALLYLTIEGPGDVVAAVEMKQTRTDHYYFMKTTYPDGGASSTNQNDNFSTPRKGTWARYVLEMDTAAGRLRNTVDGVTALDRTWPLPASIRSATVDVGLLVVSRSAAQWSARVDNVVCDVLP